MSSHRNLPPAREDGTSTDPIPIDQICEALAASAEANDLPLTFFANLIWQESRFNQGAISRAGAQGIAQFMPATAAMVGLKDPHDPLEAIPASAELLRQLQQRFGNLGLAAAAYNAGPKRVADWLANRGLLPRETRAYVSIITGAAAEQWRARDAKNEVLRYARLLPCRTLPVYAALESAASTAESEVAGIKKIHAKARGQPRLRLDARLKTRSARDNRPARDLTMKVARLAQPGRASTKPTLRGPMRRHIRTT
jgi:hypothetical protein